MKKIITLLAAGCLLFSAASAWAIDVEVKGNWGFSYGYLKNSRKFDFRPTDAGNGKGYTSDPYTFTSRVRTQVDFIASPTLSSKLYFEIGKMDWGSSDAPLDADQQIIKVKMAYMEWKPITDLTLRMGVQGIALPNAVASSPVFDDDVAGISANYRINDMVGITAFWARPFDSSTGDAGINRADETDIFALSVPIKPKGFEITPWAAVSLIGNSSDYWFYMSDEAPKGGDRGKYGYNKKAKNFASTTKAGAYDGNYSAYSGGDSSDAWWAGLSFKMDVTSPIIVSFDAIYGQLNGAGHKDNDPLSTPDASGWWLDAAVEYKAKWGIPGLFGWYSTGDNGDDVKKSKSGRMPILGLDTGFAISPYSFADGWGLRGDTAMFTSGVGTWGLGARVNKLTFMDKLSHNVQFMYIRGTNDKKAASFKQQDTDFWGVDFNGAYLTDKDKAYEVTLDSVYKFNKYLEAGLELGYIHLDLDDKVWLKDSKRGDLASTADGYKAFVSFKYRF